MIINIVLLAFAYTTLVERKLLGRMQLRLGPNRAGPFGLLQPIADLVKLVRKEAFFPGKVEALPYIVAPAFSAFAALLVFSVIPFGEGWEVGGYEIQGVVADVPIGLILFFAVGSVGVYGFIVGGWASDSKYSLLGSMRTCAQLVSYEVSLSLSVLGVILLGHSLNLSEIVNKQIDSMWYVGPQFVGFVVFFLAAVAETARAPFDLPEADSELVAGYHTEYSGMRWGLFQMAEYVNMIALSALGITLFFGGWEGPWAPLGPLWFLIKLAIAIGLFIWIRATVPRLRYDQLMRFGWKILLPVATLNARDHRPRRRLDELDAAADRHPQGLRGDVPPAVQQADHRAVPGVRAAGLPALPRAAPAAPARRTGSRSASAARCARPPARPTASASSPPRTRPTTACPPASATRASTRST